MVKDVLELLSYIDFNDSSSVVQRYEMSMAGLITQRYIQLMFMVDQQSNGRFSHRARLIGNFKKRNITIACIVHYYHIAIITIVNPKISMAIPHEYSHCHVGQDLWVIVASFRDMSHSSIIT